ncbi:glycoside hydrolase family 25 protein, partial [Streptomyces sp. NPDC101455]|uniref:glycoside hydrolase family 25 protein n=1 Tax=Streptomyces sp. NPDC101455 TaxID=3366142 RepID=UPI003821C9D7
MATSRGMDVSAYQGTQDWAGLKRDGLVFAFAKASEGTGSRDSRFDAHIAGIIKARLVPGAYHFAWPNQGAAGEAANYIAAVRPYAKAGSGFTHWLDLERYSDGRNYSGRTAAQIKAYAAAWIAAVQKAFPGQRVGIYTSASDLTAGHVPDGVPLWYPAYPWGAAAYSQAEAAAQPRPSGRAVL